MAVKKIFDDCSNDKYIYIIAEMVLIIMEVWKLLSN